MGDIDGALAAHATLLRHVGLRLAMSAKEFGHHVHVNELSNAPREAWTAAAAAVGNVAQADVDLFQAATSRNSGLLEWLTSYPEPCGGKRRSGW